MEINFNVVDKILAKKIFKWGLAAIVIGYVSVVLIRIPHFYNLKKTEEQVAKIHATKLALADVMGENLPPDPGPLADQTIEGVDANQNGIRDDVELAIFEEYPNSAKIRAALLQYALALQMQTTLDVVNKETFTETIANNETKALNCIWSLVSRDDLEKFIDQTTNYENFVKKLQYDTPEREVYYENLIKGNLQSFSSSTEGCDIDISSLSN